MLRCHSILPLFSEVDTYCSGNCFLVSHSQCKRHKHNSSRTQGHTSSISWKRRMLRAGVPDTLTLTTSSVLHFSLIFSTTSRVTPAPPTLVLDLTLIAACRSRLRSAAGSVSSAIHAGDRVARAAAWVAPRGTERRLRVVVEPAARVGQHTVVGAEHVLHGAPRRAKRRGGGRGLLGGVSRALEAAEDEGHGGAAGGAAGADGGGGRARGRAGGGGAGAGAGGTTRRAMGRRRRWWKGRWRGGGSGGGAGDGGGMPGSRPWMAVEEVWRRADGV
jgi:hypothetical protein